MIGILLSGFFLLLALGVPLAFAMGIAGIFGILNHGTFPLTLVPQRILIGADSFSLLAVPFFILAGNLMNVGGLTDRMIALANAIVGRFTGGLGLGNVAASLFFSGVSGSAVADTTALGSTLIPAMKKEGYSGAFSAALTAASSICGPIIPPSIPLVIYALIAGSGVSVSALFLGGIVPGLLLGIGLMILCWLISRRRGYPKHGSVSLSTIISLLGRASFALVMPIIIVVGIVGGIFTVTESAAVAVLYALFVGLLIYRELSLKKIIFALRRSSLESAAVMIIIATASLFGWLLAISGFPDILSRLLLLISDNPLVILLIINIFLLAVDVFLEAIAALTIIVPVLVPIAATHGIDLNHLGIVLVFNLMLGLLTPPVGICLYIAGQFADTSMESVFKEVIPFFILGLFVLILITIYPEIVIFLPNILIN